MLRYMCVTSSKRDEKINSLMSFNLDRISEKSQGVLYSIVVARIGLIF